MSDDTIKVVVVSQTLKLNGKSYAITCLPVGTVLDAIPTYYGKNNSIMNYKVFFSEKIMSEYRFLNYWGYYPPEIAKPLSKVREDAINSILDD